MHFRDEQAIENLINSLEEYREGEMEPGGKEYMLDELIKVREMLHKDEVEEGRWLQEFNLHVLTGYPLPKVFERHTVISALTKETHHIDVKEISNIEWHEGGLLVVVLGHRVRESESK